jgi:hypothetical protein
LRAAVSRSQCPLPAHLPGGRKIHLMNYLYYKPQLAVAKSVKLLPLDL